MRRWNGEERGCRGFWEVSRYRSGAGRTRSQGRRSTWTSSNSQTCPMGSRTQDTVAEAATVAAAAMAEAVTRADPLVCVDALAVVLHPLAAVVERLRAALGKLLARPLEACEPGGAAAPRLEARRVVCRRVNAVPDGARRRRWWHHCCRSWGVRCGNGESRQARHPRLWADPYLVVHARRPVAIVVLPMRRHRPAFGEHLAVALEAAEAGRRAAPAVEAVRKVRRRVLAFDRRRRRESDRSGRRCDRRRRYVRHVLQP
eukprot:2537744-Prymnesium_polylepis.2